jgi:hypothetical protein
MVVVVVHSKHFDVEYFNSLSDTDKKLLIKVCCGDVCFCFLCAFASDVSSLFTSQCVRSGFENPDSSMGCYANTPSDYDRSVQSVQQVFSTRSSSHLLLLLSLSLSFLTASSPSSPR